MLRRFKIKFKVFSVSLMVFLVAVSMLIFPNVAEAKVKVVFFCTDWNAKCREAKKGINSTIAKYNQNEIEYKEFNIDLNTTPPKVREMGLDIPDQIPFIVVLDKNGKVLYESFYTSSGSIRGLDTTLNQYAK